MQAPVAPPWRGDRRAITYPTDPVNGTADKAPLRLVAVGVVEDENGSVLVAIKEEVADKAFFAELGHALLLGGTYASKAKLA